MWKLRFCFQIEVSAHMQQNGTNELRLLLKLILASRFHIFLVLD